MRLAPATPALAAAVAALLTASIGLSIARERTFPADRAEADLLYVRSGAVADRLALGYDALAADVYWIRALQHFGGTRRSEAQDKRYELLYPLLSMAVALDPLFTIAYRFGAIFLAEPWPGGPGRPDQAIALLQRGLEVRPQNWRYMQDIGFVHYWHYHDFKKAAEWFERGAAQPGAPFWMRSLAATTLAQGGDRTASRLLWETLQQSDNDWLRRDAARRLRQLDALDQIDQLRAVIARFAAGGGTRPYSWDALLRAGYLRRVPLDPDGVPYELGPWSGDVMLGESSPLQPLPAEPPGGSAR
jgi:hypothetical protein